jgi:2-polyprenyl-3-methyl-5-hydroxy-6-metoxy-1,4-benzoquinol methylase
MTTLIFTATLNEIDNIESFVSDCLGQLPRAHMLVVDDNSPDGTGEKLESLRQGPYKGRLHVVHRPRKLGVGSAHKLAMKYALKEGYQQLITMDADYSHHPRYLPIMEKELARADFVTGSRYAPGGRCDYGLGRQIISRTANFLARTLLGIRLHETTTSYRGFQRTLLERLPIDQIKAEGYAFFFESIFHASRITDRLSEFPIHFEDRRAGTSKISKKEVLKAVIRLSRLFLRRLLRMFDNYAAKPLPQDAEPCDMCGETLHVELYPATSKGHHSGMYNCSSAHHDSHGRIVRCLACGLVATNPKLPPAELEKLYSDVVDQTYVANIPARVHTFDYNFKRVKSYLPTQTNLLDVGSYYGVFLDVARNYGYQVKGVEPSLAASEFARKNYKIDVHSGTLGNMEDRGERFEVVTSWDVMEHFGSPMQEIKLINARMKTGGIFTFCTLNWDNWYARLMGERWPWLMDMHLYYFDDKIIDEMMRRTGFKLKLADTYCHIITAEYFFMKLQSLGVPMAGFMRRLVARTPLATWHIPFRFGDIRLYVAEKVSEPLIPSLNKRAHLT